MSTFWIFARAFCSLALALPVELASSAVQAAFNAVSLSATCSTKSCTVMSHQHGSQHTCIMRGVRPSHSAQCICREDSSQMCKLQTLCMSFL